MSLSSIFLIAALLPSASVREIPSDVRSEPVTTCAAANARLKSGETIYVFPGVYSEGVSNPEARGTKSTMNRVALPPGVTLESLVVAERVARAVRKKAARGEVRLDDYPLLTHVDEIITKHKPVDIPWEKFTFTV